MDEEERDDISSDSDDLDSDIQKAEEPQPE